jgi:hypothetical protein
MPRFPDVPVEEKPRDEFGGILVEDELRDEFGGILVEDELRDEFGGILVEDEPQRDTGDRSRPGYTALGATVGGFLGAPLGPLGIVGGSTLGAGAGYLAKDAIDDALRALGVRSDESPSAKTRVAGAAREMALEGTFTPAAMVAGPLLKAIGKPMLGRVLKVYGGEARKAADQAAGQGIHLGIAHLSPRRFIRAYSRVLGVFPFIGTPFRKEQTRVVGQINDRSADLLNTLAPHEQTRFELSLSLDKAAAKRFEKFRKIAATLYDRFGTLAANLTDPRVVPTEGMAKISEGIAAREARQAAPMVGGGTVGRMGDDPVGDYLNQFAQLEEFITVEQARGLQRGLNEAIRKGMSDGHDVARLGDVKHALKDAINNLDLSRVSLEEARDVAGALDRANNFYRVTKGRFETPTAQRFGRVDRKIFQSGKVFTPGTVNAEEVLDSVFSAKSPEALSDLRKLVGAREFRKTARSYLEKQVKASMIPQKEGEIIGEMFSAAGFEKRLGLDTPEGWAVMEEMLRGSDVTIKQWGKFLESAKRGTDIRISDPSQFLQRRAGIGGMAALAGGMLVAGNQITLSTAALLTLLFRQGSKFLMNPDQLRQVTRVLDDTATNQQKRAMLIRIVRPYGKEEQ